MQIKEINSPQELLEKLREQGITLWEENDKLRFKSPKGVLTDEIMQVLKKNKNEVLELLKTGYPKRMVAPDLAKRYDPFPLSDVQAAYLLGRNEAFGYGGVACHLYLEFNYDELDPVKTGQVWNKLIQRHEMLRAKISKDGYQQIMEKAPHFSVKFTDLSQQSPAEAEKQLENIRGEMGHRVYDTDQWPLFGIGVTQTNTHAVLHFSMEFLIADWASMWMLLSEFEALYDRPDNPLPQPELSFRDYLVAERELRGSHTYDKDKAYWTKRIADLPAAPALPVARKQDISSGKFVRNQLHLNIGTWSKLKQQAQKNGITPTVAVLAAYSAVLERWSRNSHFCLNLTVLNRLPLHPQVNDIVGDFTSVSLLEVNRKQGNTFLEKARTLNMQLLEDLDHRLFTGVEVIREINRQKGKEKALMPVVFTSAIGLTPASEENMLKGRITENGISQTPQVFLDCQAMDSAAGLLVNWDARKGVFPEHMIDDMFEAFENLLRSLAGDAERWNTDPDIQLPARQAAEREKANNTSAGLPQDLLHKPIVDQVISNPGQIAIIDPTCQLSYKELGLKATAVARELARQGCKAQDNVAITIPKSAYQVVAVLGCLSARAVYVPVDITQPEGRRFRMMQNADVKYVLTTKDTNLTFPENTRVIYVDELAAEKEIDLETDGDANLPAYIIYTSGSTGQPKGVVISHQAARNTIVDINKRFNVNRHDVVLGLAQLGFDLSVYDIFGLLGAGGKIVYPQPDRRTDPSHWVRLMQEHKVTVWNTVPALMQILVNYLSSEQNIKLPDLRLALLSGDWIPLKQPDELKQRVPDVQLVSLGGATEASIWSNYHIYKGLQDDWNSIPYGLPLTNQGFRVLDTQWRDCPEWTTGELYITGHGLALGYLGDEALTAEKFFKHPLDGQYMYRTGDWGRYTPGGELEFMGREDKQVKIRGHRIELGEIESAMQQHPAVGNARVIITGPGDDKILLGFVEPATKKEKNPETGTTEFNQLTEGIHDLSFVYTKGLMPREIEEAMQNFDNAVFYSMLMALQRVRLLQPDREYSSDDLLTSGKINPKFHWLVKRWVANLVKAGLLKTYPGNTYRACITTDGHTENQYWMKARSTWGNKIGSEKFIEYVRNNASVLPELLEGKQNPVSLLFPEGKSDYVKALYIDNTIVRYLNQSICILLKRIAGRNPEKRLRVLEIGAGTGATTVDVLETLKEHKIDYLFTDIAATFVTNARTTFKSYPGIRFGVYDIDKDYREQGLAPNSFDVVLAAGVLENSRNIPVAMKNISELVCPGGWFIYTEPTLEHPWIMISQAFMMQEPDDELRQSTSYLGRETWLKLTRQFGSEPVFSLPEPGDTLSLLGYHMFATQMKKDRMNVTPDELASFLGKNVPAYMVPSHIQVVDHFPLTNNGKTDINKMAGWQLAIVENEGNVSNNTDEIFSGEIEMKLADMWAKALSLPRIGKNDNFYKFGADSLIMAQMAGKMRDEFSDKKNGTEIPFDIMLREILNTPTVGDLAKFISSCQAVKGETARHEKNVIQPDASNIGAYTDFGGGGAGPLRLVLPAGLGTMDCFRPLINLLTKQNLGTVLGVSVADIERYCKAQPLELIEEVADDYAAHIIVSGYEKVQIIGYCLGCLSATEVARRLRENGVEIVDLILIDGHRVPFHIEDDIIIETLYLPNLFVTTEQAGFGSLDAQLMMNWFIKTLRENNNSIPRGAACQIGGTDELNKLGDVFRKLSTFNQEERFDAYIKAMPGTSGEKMPREMILRMFRTYCQSFQAARFAPAPYFGDIRYLQAEDDSSFLPGMSKQVIEFWSNICLGKFSVGTIKGDHYTCIEPPFVGEVAEIVAAPFYKQ